MASPIKMSEMEHTMATQEQKQIESQIEMLQNQLAKSKVKSLIFRDFGLNDSKKALLHKSFNVQIAKPEAKPEAKTGKKRMVFHDGIPDCKYKHCVAVAVMKKHGFTWSRMASVFKKYNYKYFDTASKCENAWNSWIQSGYMVTLNRAMAKHEDHVTMALRKENIL